MVPCRSWTIYAAGCLLVNDEFHIHKFVVGILGGDNIDIVSAMDGKQVSTSVDAEITLRNVPLEPSRFTNGFKAL